MTKVIAFLRISSAQLWAWIAALSTLCHIHLFSDEGHPVFFAGIGAGEIEFLMVNVS